MDAKSKANFINSVSSNSVCPSCGAEVLAGYTFCEKCGNQVNASTIERQASPTVVPTPLVTYIEPAPMFAEGLPEWSLEPPAIVIRRRARR